VRGRGDSDSEAEGFFSSFGIFHGIPPTPKQLHPL
jgi:hypothetical protein